MTVRACLAKTDLSLTCHCIAMAMPGTSDQEAD